MRGILAIGLLVVICILAVINKPKLNRHVSEHAQPPTVAGAVQYRVVPSNVVSAGAISSRSNILHVSFKAEIK